MSDSINIQGIDKAELLAALYNGSKPQGLGFLHFASEPMTVEQAQKILDSSPPYFDYLQGRVMKIDISEDEVSPWGYDRDNGHGAVQQIVDELRRNGGDVYTEVIERRHLENTRKSALELQDHLYEPSKTEIKGDTATFTLGLDKRFSDMLAPILSELLGEGLSGHALLRAILSEEPEIDVEEAETIVEADATDIKSRGWYMVKQQPQSAEARRIAGQLVTVVDIDRKSQTVSVFTLSVFRNKGGVAVRVPISDLTNR